MTSDQHEFEHVTTDAVVASYEASVPIFAALLTEVKVLSNKKPEATMSAGKVKIINQVLDDLYVFLKSEPTGKYLSLLDDKALPQMSDAVLVMVQFETAVNAFRERYRKEVDGVGDDYWITEEQLKAWDEADEGDKDGEDDEEDEDE